MGKPNEEQDRTTLAERWAAAVANLDEIRDRLAAARRAEREAWSALERSRRASVPGDE